MSVFRSKSTLAFFLIIILCGANLHPFFVSAQVGGSKDEIEELNRQIAEKKDKVKELEKNIEEYKKKITQTQTKAKSLSNQLSILDTRISKTNLDIETTETKLDTLTLEIEAFQLAIDDKQKVVDRQRDMIGELIQTIHEEDGKSYVEIMAAYENFSDFYNRVQYLEKIDRDLGKSVRALKSVKQDLEDKKKQTEERRKRYEDLNAQLSQQRVDLQEQTYSKQELLTKTKASEATYSTLLSSLKKQYQQIEGEINSIEQQVRKKLEAEHKLDNLGDGSGAFSWPTASRYITARFYDPDYPYRNVFEHNAIDIRASQGTAVKAAGSGYVARAKRCTVSSCYAYVMLVHADGLSTVYGHLSSIGVKEEQFVTRGDIIGYSGGTPGTVGAGPFVTGPHLHFEVRLNGIPVDPIGYLVKDY